MTSAASPNSVPPPSTAAPTVPGSRYELLAKIATGGMAIVYVGRLRGPAGFSRLCAVKRAHAHLVEDPAFRKQLVTEARLTSRVRHPNVVSMIDVEELAGELLLVMEYVEGGALADLLARASARGRRLSPGVVIRIALDACAGLRAAHEALDDDGRPLGLVHRDVSPQNLLVGLDGLTRLADFGIAKCVEAAAPTTKTVTGGLKGKIAYMAPEYVRGRGLDARSDLFALGVVVWEALADSRLFRADNEVDTIQRVVAAPVPPLSRAAPWIGSAFDGVLARVLDKTPGRRYPDAQAFASALEQAAIAAGLAGTHNDVAAEVAALIGVELTARRALLFERIEGAGVQEPAPLSAPSVWTDTVQMEAIDRLASASPSIRPPAVAEPRTARSTGRLVPIAVVGALGVGLVIGLSLRAPRAGTTSEVHEPPEATAAATPAASAPPDVEPSPLASDTAASPDAAPSSSPAASATAPTRASPRSHAATPAHPAPSSRGAAPQHKPDPNPYGPTPAR